MLQLPRLRVAIRITIGAMNVGAFAVFDWFVAEAWALGATDEVGLPNERFGI